MTARRRARQLGLADVLTVEVRGHTAWLSGVPNYRVRLLLDRYEIPRLYDVQRRIWMCPARRVDDVTRSFAARGGAVDVHREVAS